MESENSKQVIKIEFAETSQKKARDAETSSWREGSKKVQEKQRGSRLKRLKRYIEKSFHVKLVRVRHNILAEDERLHEEHHKAYGRPWSSGRDHIDYLVSRGLNPQHKVLDLGCGGLRSGIWIIPYLEKGKYFGIEPHLWSLEAAVYYEIPLHNLEHKLPRFLCTDQFEIGHFKTRFDYILAFSVFNHLTEKEKDQALKEMTAHLEPSGIIVLTVDLPFAEKTLSEKYGLMISYRDKRKSKLITKRGLTEWTELRREEVVSWPEKRGLA